MVEEAIAAAAGGVESLAGEVGVSYGTIWAWAKGKRHPSRRNMTKLAKVLRRRGERLLGIADKLEGGA